MSKFLLGQKENNSAFKLSKKRRNDLLFYSIILAWPVLQFAVFYIGVNFNSILLAFKKYETSNVYSWQGFDNFKSLFLDFKQLTIFRQGLKNSIVLFLIGTTSGILLGLLFSFYIYKKMIGNGFFKVILFLPSIIPSIALIVMFKQITDNAVPAVFDKLFHMQIKGLLTNPKTTFSTILFYNVWAGFGVSVLLYVGSMGNISESVVEAAKLDGANYFTEFTRITIPLIWGTLSTFIICSVGGIFVNQGAVYAFYGDMAEENIVTIGYWLYRETIKTGAQASYPKLAAAGVLLSLISMPLIYCTKWLLNKLGPCVE